ncbi:hypothetical protein PG993_014037 [Apiospora rasikravindrae]|uniref:F-box domain-containing protein n=1 Tax=Apiospora rasikravindrae TaxID=990691 RepID=A0ABR1RRW0_9PEZI
MQPPDPSSSDMAHIPLQGMENPVLDGKEPLRTSLPIAEDARAKLAHVAGQVIRLEALPEELILNIFKCTPHDSCVCLSQASRKLRRISKSSALKDYHEWQDEMLQACWPDDDRRKVSPALGGWRSWFTDGNDNRSALGQQLRKDLFCAGCQQAPSNSSSSSLWKSELMDWRQCDTCPDQPLHRVWQFLADGTCLRSPSLVRLCPHQSCSAQDGRVLQRQNCRECGSSAVATSRFGISENVKFRGLLTSWPLLEKHGGDSATPAPTATTDEPHRLLLANEDLGARDLALRLVDRCRLHERLYICPHHPIDNDRDRCATQLAPLLRSFRTGLVRAVKETYIPRFPLFVGSVPVPYEHKLICIHCGVHLSLRAHYAYHGDLKKSLDEGGSATAADLKDLEIRRLFVWPRHHKRRGPLGPPPRRRAAAGLPLRGAPGPEAPELV